MDSMDLARNYYQAQGQYPQYQGQYPPHAQYQQQPQYPQNFQQAGGTGRPKATPSKASKRKIKDPNRPKRPTSAYFYFVAGERTKNAAIGKKITRVAEWTKEVSAIWRALTPDEKIPFDVLAVKDKARYTSEMAIFKGRTVDPNKPKRPMSSYFLWLGLFRTQNKARFEGRHKELLSAAGESWKALTPPERVPWEKKAEIEKKKYEEVMKVYNQNKAAGVSVAVPAAAPVPVQAAKKPRMDAGGDAKNGGQDDDDDEEDDEEEYSDEEDDE